MVANLFFLIFDRVVLTIASCVSERSLIYDTRRKFGELERYVEVT